MARQMKGSVVHQVERDRRQWIEDTPGSFPVDPLYEPAGTIWWFIACRTAREVDEVTNG